MSKSNFCLAVFVVLALVFAATLYFRVSHIEMDLTNRAIAAAKAEGFHWVLADADGRDLTLKGQADTVEARSEAVRIVKAVWGVREVKDQVTVAADRAALAIPTVTAPRRARDSQSSGVGDRSWRIEKRDGGLVLTGLVPDAEAHKRLIHRAALLYPNKVTDRTRVGDGPDRGAWGQVAELALAQTYALRNGVATLSDGTLTVAGTTDAPERKAQLEAALDRDLPDGFEGIARIDVDTAQRFANEGSRLCRMTFDRLLSSKTIEFDSGSVALKPENNLLLDELALAASQCPAARIEISGHTDSTGAADKNMTLSHGRALAVLGYLKNAGVDARRLTAVGFGAAFPLVSNQSDAGRARNRRIEFKVIK